MSNQINVDLSKIDVPAIVEMAHKEVMESNTFENISATGKDGNEVYNNLTDAISHKYMQEFSSALFRNLIKHSHVD